MKFLLIFLIFVAFTKAKNRENCGRRSGFIENSFGGEEVRRNSWPWLVAFVYWQNEKFFCAGNLISEKHVLSGD